VALRATQVTYPSCKLYITAPWHLEGAQVSFDAKTTRNYRISQVEVNAVENKLPLFNPYKNGRTCGRLNLVVCRSSTRIGESRFESPAYTGAFRIPCPFLYLYIFFEI
jgi:hypothetical protein